jgi:DNA-binding response OmpR family regulator
LHSAAEKTVLMVDDDPIMHLLYRHHLTKAGFRVVDAQNGEEALQLLQRELPELIILDVLMPGKDGLSVLREIRQIEALQFVPVIMITANTHPLLPVESAACGANSFLTKPFSPAQLMERIRHLIPEEM